MGSNYGYSDERPIHRVTISKSFWIGKYEVTQKEYKALMNSNPSALKGDKNPVERVSWYDAVKFCEKLTAHERNAGRLPSGYKYRLPTEAEWEYAALGGTKSRGFKYSGSDDIGAVAWYDDNSDNKSHIVGKKQPNELGIYDMSGNVFEWCQDWRGNYPSDSVTDPEGLSSGSLRIIRGGSWFSIAGHCRLVYRGHCLPLNDGNSLGFRVCLACAP